MRVALASQSPSRAAILRAAGIEPVLAPANVDERAIEAGLSTAAPAEIVAALATAKAEKVAPSYPHDLVIGGDSMLLLDGVLQGKPLTTEATVARWRVQAGRRAELLTGHCIIAGKRRHVETSRTAIYFAQASQEDIAAYAASGEPLNCAGAFTLEALGGWFIDRIDGDPSSVIGLSLPVVRRAIYLFGWDVSNFWSKAQNS